MRTHESPTVRGDHPTRGRAIAALTGYLLLASLHLATVWNDGGGSRRVAGGGEDPLLFVWHLARLPFAVANGRNPLFSEELMAPGGANMLANTSSLLPSALLSPVTELFGPLVSYNLLVTMSLALSAWAAYLACRRITGSEAGSLVCGLLYGFGPYMQFQTLVHPQMGLAVFPPLALVLLHELTITQQRSPHRVGAALGAGCVAQLLTGEELLATTVLMGALLVVVLGVTHRGLVRSRIDHLVRGLVTAGVVGLVLAGPLVMFQLFGPRGVDGLLQPRNTFVADPVGVVVPSPMQLMSTPSTDRITARLSGLDGEYSVYLGLPLLLFAAWAAWRLRRDAIARVASLMAALSLVLSMGGILHVNGHRLPVPLPWLVVTHVPLIENVLPSRFALFTTLALGVLLARLVATSASCPSAARRGIWLALTVALVSMAPAAPPPTARVSTPEFFLDGARAIPADTITAIYPRQSGSYLAMAAQAAADFRFRLAQGGVFTPDGFGSPPTALYDTMLGIENVVVPSGPAAACFPEGVPDLTAGCRALIASDIEHLGIGAVIVLDHTGSAQMVDLLTAYFRRAPTSTGGVRYWLAPESGP